MTRRILWCDMDGVLALYNREDYIGENPVFLEKGSHYFSKLQPDMKMVDTLTKLNEQHPDIEIQIISNVTKEQYDEQMQDKKEWIEKYLPFINTDTNFQAITVPKYSHIIEKEAEIYEYYEEFPEKYQEMLQTLISDFNKDLEPFVNTEVGVGIKYLNGINSPESYEGFKIKQSDSVDTLVQELVTITQHKELMPLSQKLHRLSYYDKLELIEKQQHLDIFLQDQDAGIRSEVALQNYGLEQLVHDPFYMVRETVAKQGYGLEILVNDEHPSVRSAVAEQGYGLEQLLNDKSESVGLIATEKFAKEQTKDLKIQEAVANQNDKNLEFGQFDAIEQDFG